VIAQNPAADAKVDRDTTIRLVLATAPNRPSPTNDRTADRTTHDQATDTSTHDQATDQITHTEQSGKYSG
jgi:beta-lactam-binding protein with PASTA domain